MATITSTLRHTQPSFACYHLQNISNLHGQSSSNLRFGYPRFHSMLNHALSYSRLTLPDRPLLPSLLLCCRLLFPIFRTPV